MEARNESVTLPSRKGAQALEKTLEDLYAAHIDEALRLAFVLTGSKETAEDLAQDAFLRVAGRLGSLREPQRFDAYLKRTVVNLSRSLGRRLRTERSFLRQQESMVSIAEDSPDPDRKDLWRLLLRLPARQRIAIFLRYHNDMSDLQIADTLGCSSGAVKALRVRGLCKLRSEWGERDE